MTASGVFARRARQVLARYVGGVSRRLAGLEFDDLMSMGADVMRTLPSGRGVALTFDDGPSGYSTRQILHVLDAHDAPATFFLLGANVRRHGSLAADIASCGHTVGVHGDQHLDYHWASPAAIRDDLRTAKAAIEDAVGSRVCLLRAPYGHVRWDVPRIARGVGLTDLVGWSVAPAWHEVSPERLAGYVASRLDPGAIVLLHDGNGLEQADPHGRTAAVVAALPAIIQAIRTAGLEPTRIQARPPVDPAGPAFGRRS